MLVPCVLFDRVCIAPHVIYVCEDLRRLNQSLVVTHPTAQLKIAVLRDQPISSKACISVWNFFLPHHMETRGLITCKPMDASHVN